MRRPDDCIHSQGLLLQVPCCISLVGHQDHVSRLCPAPTRTWRCLHQQGAGTHLPEERCTGKPSCGSQPSPNAMWSCFVMPQVVPRVERERGEIPLLLCPCPLQAATLCSQCWRLQKAWLLQKAPLLVRHGVVDIRSAAAPTAGIRALRSGVGGKCTQQLNENMVNALCSSEQRTELLLAGRHCSHFSHHRFRIAARAQLLPRACGYHRFSRAVIDRRSSHTPRKPLEHSPPSAACLARRTNDLRRELSTVPVFLGHLGRLPHASGQVSRGASSSGTQILPSSWS